ncbi:hypothetical protein [Burkholderia cenocepacia]|uniref:hypothetical protein n=1 Tax=Burkholderia cenocepacia TaxID=95486 RepID=UPI002AB0FC43|nr:hypothetical protein [Burkholderia cenocepacia]
MKIRASDLLLMLVCGVALGGGIVYGMSDAKAEPPAKLTAARTIGAPSTELKSWGGTGEIAVYDDPARGVVCYEAVYNYRVALSCVQRKQA